MRSVRNSEASATLSLLCLGAALAGCAPDPALSTDAGAGPECAASERGLPDGGCIEWPICAEGFEPHPSGLGCVEIAPVTDCPAGSTPRLGQRECQPVGWSVCAEGFELDPEGWGCVEVGPAMSCTGGTLERLGQRRCQPVGDCDAPFPPAGATHFVDDDYATVDATHFRSIFDAVLSAPTGAVIAVESGLYVENVDVVRDVTVVGRCAAQVTVKGPGDNRAGFLVADGATLQLRGVTLTGHLSGVYVHLGAKATVEDSLLVANRWMGAYALGQGSRATLVRTRVAGTMPDAQNRYGWGIGAQGGAVVELTDAAVVESHGHGVVASTPGSLVRLLRTLVRDTRVQAGGTDSGRLGVGVSVASGGRAEVTSSALVSNRTANLAVQDSESLAIVTGSVLRGALADTIGEYGRNVQVTGAGRVLLQESTVVDAADANVVILGAGSAATLERAVVRGGPVGEGVLVAPGAVVELKETAVVANQGAGVVVQQAAEAVVADSLVRDTRTQPDGSLGMGIQVGYGGQLQLLGSALVRNHSVGLLVTRKGGDGAPARAVVHRSLVRDTLPGKNGYGHGIEVNLAGKLELSSSAVARNHQVGLGVALEGEAVVSDSVVRDTRPLSDRAVGHGVLVFEGARARLTGTHVRGNAAIGLAISNASAGVQGGEISDNSVGLHVQEGVRLREVTQVPDQLEPLEAVVSSDTHFQGNGTRLGSGMVPLPDPFQP